VTPRPSRTPWSATDLELDVLTVAGLGFRVVTYTAEQDTATESNLDALRPSVRGAARPADR
jgi:hypothetical protein